MVRLDVKTIRMNLQGLRATPSRKIWCAWLAILFACFACQPWQTNAGAQEIHQQEIAPPNSIDATNDVVIELFYRGDMQSSHDAIAFLDQLQQRRTGINVKTYDVLKNRFQLKRLWKISKQFGHEKAGSPTLYLCNRLKVGFDNAENAGTQVEELLNIKAYIRPGCKHCQAGKEFLDQFSRRWPALRVEYHDVISDPGALKEMQNLAARYRVQVPSFPCIQVAGRLVVGFQTAEITGRNIEALFQDRSSNSINDHPAKVRERPSDSMSDVFFQSKRQGDAIQPDVSKSSTRLESDTRAALTSRLTRPDIFFLAYRGTSGDDIELSALQDSGEQDELGVPDEVPLPDDVPLPDEVTLPDEMSLPDEWTDEPIVADEPLSSGESDRIEVPFFGELSVSKLGMPTFTFLIGLVDGFNPCAMWVLIFLLSVLVNIKERKKILVVAGTFVVVSGLAYFAFMAAWFNVFQLIGFLRPVQIGLGLVAIVVGAINVKDFFAFHKGITLSIPESAKPGIYRRVRKIVAAKHLTTALCGAIVLAIVVNIVELLCTAGLPALYTEVLTMQNLPVWANYAYLGLYISAYMLDDAVLVAIVVSTLSHRRLQENEGRWLKMLSGSVILLLGIVMIFWPEALV